MPIVGESLNNHFLLDICWVYSHHNADHGDSFWVRGSQKMLNLHTREMKRWNMGKQTDFLDWRYLLMKSPLPSQSYLHKTQIRLSTMIHQHKSASCLRPQLMMSFLSHQKMGQKPPCFSHLHFWEQQKPQTAILLFVQLPQLRVLRSSFWKPNTSSPSGLPNKKYHKLHRDTEVKPWLPRKGDSFLSQAWMITWTLHIVQLPSFTIAGAYFSPQLYIEDFLGLPCHPSGNVSNLGCPPDSCKIQLERHRISAPLSSKHHANSNRPQFHSIAALPLQFLHWPHNGDEKRFWTWETW